MLCRRGIPRIKVTFYMDVDGILHVSAKDLTTQKEKAIEVKPSSGLNDEEIESMIEEAKKRSENDEEKLKQAQKKNQLEELVYRTDKKLQELGDRLSGEEKNEVWGG